MVTRKDPAGIEKPLVLPVLLGIQNVFASCMPKKREHGREPITSWETQSRKRLAHNWNWKRHIKDQHTIHDRTSWSSW